MCDSLKFMYYLYFFYFSLIKMYFQNGLFARDENSNTTFSDSYSFSRFVWQEYLFHHGLGWETVESQDAIFCYGCNLSTTDRQEKEYARGLCFVEFEWVGFDYMKHLWTVSFTINLLYETNKCIVMQRYLYIHLDHLHIRTNR